MSKMSYDREAVTTKMGELLLQGYCLLDSNCNDCSNPLMRSRKGDLICVSCDFQNKTKFKDKLLDKMSISCFKRSSDFEEADDDGIESYKSILKQNIVPVFNRIDDLEARAFALSMIEEMKFLKIQLDSNEYNQCLNDWKRVFTKELKEFQDCIANLDFSGAVSMRNKIHQNIVLKNDLSSLVYSSG